MKWVTREKASTASRVRDIDPTAGMWSLPDTTDRGDITSLKQAIADTPSHWNWRR